MLAFESECAFIPFIIWTVNLNVNDARKDILET